MSVKTDRPSRSPPFVIDNNFNQSYQQQSTNNSTTAPEHVYARERPIPLSFCESSQKYKPQSNSISAGIGLLCVSGIHLSWALWRTLFWTNSWISGLSTGVVIFVMCSWFLGAIIGSVVGAVLVDLYRKKIIYYIAGVSYLLSGILFIAWYNEYAAILAGRLLAGFGHGIVYVTVITHAAENSIKQMRGMILSSVNYMITFGMFIGIIIMYSVNPILTTIDYYPDMLIGIITVIFSFISLLCAKFFTYESIVFLLRNGCEHEALTSMMKLRNESSETQQIRRDMLEIKLMINEEKLLNKNIFSDGNFRPLQLMILTRVQYVATNNFAINLLLVMFTDLILGPSTIIGLYRYSPLILMAARMLAGIFILFTIYFWPRKVHLIVSQISCIISMIIFATVALVALEFPQENIAYYVPGIFAILFQIFAAIGIDPMQHILISEAFSSPKLAWSITIVTAIENIIQMVLIGIFFDRYFYSGLSAGILHFFTYFTAAVIIFCVIILHFTLPETNKLSLKEARDVFVLKHFRGTILPGITYS